jgi:hypothetical protein
MQSFSFAFDFSTQIVIDNSLIWKAAPRLFDPLVPAICVLIDFCQCFSASTYECRFAKSLVTCPIQDCLRVNLGYAADVFLAGKVSPAQLQEYLCVISTEAIRSTQYTRLRRVYELHVASQSPALFPQSEESKSNSKKTADRTETWPISKSRQHSPDDVPASKHSSELDQVSQGPRCSYNSTKGCVDSSF